MDKSDNEKTSDNEDDKDEDFNIKDYQNDIDSDDSFVDDYADENTAPNDDESETEREFTGPILPGGHRFDNKLLCIKYPGVVQNPEKALETLGGLGSISGAMSTQNRRLELRFRPNDGFCKPTCGDRHQTAGFLLRVRIKKTRADQMQTEASKNTENSKIDLNITKLDELLGSLGKKNYSSDSDTENNEANLAIEKLAESVKNDCKVRETNVPEIREREIKFTVGNLSTKPKFFQDNNNKNKIEDLSSDENYEVPKVKVVGRVETEVKFQNLCDFQYLPIAKSLNDPKIDECIYDSVYPAEIPSYRWLKNKVPYFLPPPAFSRMDSVQQYSLKTESGDKGPENTIGKTRKRRAGFSNYIHFSNPETPSVSPPGIETARQIKFLQQSHLERMRKEFDERPVWSKNALICVTNFTAEQLKFLLPSVAYYFMDGPWRVMWVKLGYDPRKDPQARKYQTLDYRLKAMHGLESTVKLKRTPSEYTLPYKSVQASRALKAAILGSMADESESQKIDKSLADDVYIYREGIIPPSRQMFYQYCDVHVDEIQEMLAKLPNHFHGVKCHEKRGWLPSGFSDQCREIINRQVRVMLRKQMNIPEDHPTALPPKRRIRKNLNIGKLTTEELKMRRTGKVNMNRKKRKEPNKSESEESTAIDGSPKKLKSSSTT